MRKRKVWACAVLSAAMAASLMTGCGSSKTTDGGTAASADTKAAGETTAEKGAETDASKTAEEPVTLKWYMSLNPVDADTDKVIAALNEYTKEKIGVTIDYTVIANPDYKEKMPTLINSGEYFDICFTADWTTNYVQFVAKDAFMDITDAVKQYAPETYEFIPESLWKAVSVNGKIYGVPSYKEMGWQSGFFVNSTMAEKYGIDLSSVKTLEDYTEVLKTVKEKADAAGEDVIGLSGLGSSGGSFNMLYPYESLSGSRVLPGAAAVPEYEYFKDQTGVFNQYATQEYMDYCKLVRSWYEAGYMSKDPVNYDTDIANRDNDFKNGKLFSYIISYAPGAAEAEAAKTGHGVTFVPLMDPLFETKNARGGILAISSASEHPDKALELINLLNTDEYVGTLIRHGIEGQHYSAVGDNQVDRTMGGTLKIEDNGYVDYTYGWQFGTPFNQKWDISYPDNIEQLFEEYNAKAITAPHNGFTLDNSPVETEIAAISNVVDENAKALESGMVDPEVYIPQFLDALNKNGVEDLLAEISKQLTENGYQ